MRLTNNKFKKGYRFYRYPKPFLILLPLILLALIYFLMPVQAVEISSENKTIKIFEVEKKSEIYIDYVHSVAKTPIRDVMEINENHLFLLTRTEYSSFGAGLPTDSAGNFQLKDGIYINSGLDKELDLISLRVGRFADHKLVFEDGRSFIFKDFLEGGDLVIIKPVQIFKILALIY